MEKREHTRLDLLYILHGYRRMIERDNGQHPAAVLDDIYHSILFVLARNGYADPAILEEE
jgi:hypothetical protein